MPLGEIGEWDRFQILLTAYPDGTPAACDVTVVVNGVEHQAQTGAYGLGALRLTPADPYAEVQLRARDALGHAGEATAYFEPERWSGSQVLLRPERATYRVGETLHLEVLTTESAGAVYLDITREGQTLSTRALDLVEGRATAAIDLTPDLYGTLAVHAYKPLSSGEIVRDTRLVVVDAATDLALDVELDRDTYRPGEEAGLQIAVSDGAGIGVAAALGLAVVDESVFALQEQDPGFARLYFLLERELLEPKFDLHGLSLGEIMGQAGAAQDTAAKASLAGFGGDPFSLQASSAAIKQQQAEERQAALLEAVSRGLFPLLLLLPLAVVVALGYGLWREGVLGRSLATGIGLPILLIGLVLGALWLLPFPGAPWASDPLEKLGYLLEELGPALLCLVVPAVAGGLAGLIGNVAIFYRPHPDREKRHIKIPPVRTGPRRGLDEAGR